MSYKLYTDKPGNFVCEVSAKNASLKGALARLVVESTEGVNLVFNGQIKDGKCSVPIKKLKGFLEENAKGKMCLEVIVEDTYFKPWETDYIVESHTKVAVKIDETSTGPSVKVNVPSSPQKISLHPCTVELFSLCESFNITKKSLITKVLSESKVKDFSQLVNEYFTANSEYKGDRKKVLTQLLIVMK